MSGLRVLVVGASIAGPTAAYWFAKAGANVTVIERFPKLRPNGQNVDIRTSGVAVMRKMPGMEAAVRAKKTHMDGISFVRDDGRPYGTIKATGNPDQQSLVSEYEIFRGDLSKILYDMTEDNENIKYVFGEQVTSIQQKEQDDGPVTVEFANGFPTAEYDLVVACDGATSRTRALGLGCSVRDYTQSMNCWSALFSIEKDLLGGSTMGHAHSATGGRFSAFGPDPSGITRVTLMNVNDRESAMAFREAAKKGDDALKQFIAKHYHGAGWKTDDIIKGLMEAEDFYGYEMFQVKPPNLYKGRFVLVGDAGYAGAPGSGTTLAITGAYVLAGEVARHKGDLAAALAAYEKYMRPMSEDLQKVPSFFFTMLAPQTAWGIWFRNNIFAVIVWSRVLEFCQKFFAGSFASSDKYKLPNYEWVD